MIYSDAQIRGVRESTAMAIAARVPFSTVPPPEFIAHAMEQVNAGVFRTGVWIGGNVPSEMATYYWNRRPGRAWRKARKAERRAAR